MTTDAVRLKSRTDIPAQDDESTIDEMKHVTDRPYADPEKTARKLMEIAFAVEPVQGRIHIEKINGPMLFKEGASPAEYWAGLQLAIAHGWLTYHESGTFVTFTPAGAEMFA